MSLDIEKLTTANPLLHGEGLIAICGAAKAIGLRDAELLGELLNDRASVFTHAERWLGWYVSDLDEVERDYDGSYIVGSIRDKGENIPVSGIFRFAESIVALSGLIERGMTEASVFAHGDRAGFFLDEVADVPLSACLVQKSAVERCRKRVATGVSPGLKKAAVALPKPFGEGVVISDAITVKHGHKRFSELFALYRNHRKWGEDQSRRMTTEAGLFIELMDDPQLGSIEVETIHEYARRLKAMPTDIYQSRRRFKVESLHDLIEIAEREGLARKNDDTVRGHVGRIAEILNYADKKGMMHANPASGFKREWGVTKKARPQDARDVLSYDELAAIFSQRWFVEGAGRFHHSGATHWRPHYYWLPLLALTTGGRLNELAQLYLDDVVQPEQDGAVWYLDFNLSQPDKADIDDNDVQSDKSLKTVNALRVVPLHDVIVRAGFPEYVIALRKAGHVRLFPELKRDDTKGYGKPAGSWFNERFLGNKLEIERNGKKTFHSLRHNFATALERLELTERLCAQLMGHERGRTQTATRYAKDRDAVEMKSIIDRLAFPCLLDLGKFDASAGMRAVKHALRLKKANGREKPTMRAQGV